MEVSKKLAELKPTMLNCNAFSVYDYPESYTITELLCEFFKAINGCIELCNKTIDLAEWLVNEGLSIEVSKKLDLWLQDGTLQEIINEKIFKELNEKVDTNKNNIDTLNTEFTKYKQDSNNEIELIKQNLNSVYVFSDDYPSLQQAHDAVVAKGGGTLIINKDYVIDKGFKWDCSKVILDGQGHKIESSETNTEFVVYVKSSNTESHPYYQAHIECKNLAIKHYNRGNGGIYFDSIPSKALSHITFRNCSIENTELALWLKNSTYLLKFVDCDIFNNKDVFLVSAVSNDSGENIQFRGCAIYNNEGGFRSDNGNCDIYLDSCSLDYNVNKSIIDINNVKVFLNNCHIEHRTNEFGANVPFVVKGDAGQLFINNSLIMFSNPNETTMANIFYTTGGNSCISISNTFMFGCMTTSGYLCGGTGNLYLDNVKVNIVPMCNLAIHPSITTSAIGSMESDKLVDIWITEDTAEINGIQTSGQNGNISVDTGVSLKYGRSIKIQKIGGGGSPFSVRTVFPIDKQSINNVRIALKKLSGSGTVYIDFGYCVSQNGIDYTVSKGTETKVYSESVTEWETIEKTMMTSPLWATHGYINIATGNANAIQLNIGEIVSNSI